MMMMVIIIAIPSPVSLVGRFCCSQTHGLVFALSVMDEGVGCGSSKRKGLLIPSAVVKSLQISIWWERALGGVERPHPGDFRTRGLNKTLRPVSSRGSCQALGCAAGYGGYPRRSEHPLPVTWWHWKEKLGEGTCQKSWQQGGEGWVLLRWRRQKT